MAVNRINKVIGRLGTGARSAPPVYEGALVFRGEILTYQEQRLTYNEEEVANEPSSVAGKSRTVTYTPL